MPAKLKTSKRVRSVFNQATDLVQKVYDSDGSQEEFKKGALDWSVVLPPNDLNWPVELIMFARRALEVVIEEVKPSDQLAYEGVGGGLSPEGERLRRAEIIIDYDPYVFEAMDSKASVLFLGKGEGDGARHLHISLNPSFFDKIGHECVRYAMILAVIFHEIGHIALKDNALWRFYEKLDLDEVDNELLKPNIEDERSAWVFAHSLRAIARSEMGEEIFEDELIQAFG